MILVDSTKKCLHCNGSTKLVYTRDSKSARLQCYTCRKTGPAVSVDGIIEDHCLSAWKADMRAKRIAEFKR